MNILIVDDSVTGRNFLKKEFSEAAFAIDEASSGEVALRMLQEKKYDLVTLDIEMPLLSGYEVCENIRTSPKTPTHNRLVPIIFVTANDTLDGRMKGFQAGATDFINKKFTKGELLSLVNKLLYPEKKFEDLTILVVDDSRVARAHASLAFKRYGVHILEADDGQKAFDILKKGSEKIDLVITDQDMPALSGMDLCRKIRHDLGMKDIPVIFLTGESRPQGILDIFKAGATDYLAKPYIAEELLARIGVRLEACSLQDRLSKNIAELSELHRQKDMFLSACSHDFKTPLNTIMGYSSILLRDQNLPESVSEDLRRIHTAGELSLKMVQNIVDLTRFRNAISPPQDLVPVGQVLDNSIKMTSPAARQKKIKYDFHKKIATSKKVLGDSVELVRLFNNILNNAIKFTDSGGLINVTLDADENQFAKISIQDTGIGIPEAKLPKIFSNYAKESRKGTLGEKGSGMGLAISYEIVQRHGGTIEVESEVDVGTTFTISIPLAEISSA